MNRLLERLVRRDTDLQPRVVIYPGLGKTGTTALQTFLRCLPSTNDDRGPCYLNDPLAGNPVIVGSGNGVELSSAMRAGTVEDVRDGLTRLLAPTGSSVVSCEIIGACSSAADWQKLERALSSFPHSTRIVVVMRDLYPFAWSAYQQWVKRHGYGGTFSTCVAEEPIDQHLTNMHDLLDGVTQSEIRALRYESIRSNLLENLLEAGDVDVDRRAIRDFEDATAANPPNRSLTIAELRVARAVNRRFGDRYSTWVSDSLIAQPPVGERSLPIDPHLVERVQARFGERLESVARRVRALNAQQPYILDTTSYPTISIDAVIAKETELHEVLDRLRSSKPPSDELAETLRSLAPSSLAHQPL